MSGLRSLAPVCGLIFASLVEFRVFVLLHRENLHELAVAAHDVTVGTPHWRAFQNRVLGPYAVALVSAISGVSYETAHGLFLAALTIAANLIAFTLFRRLTGSVEIAFRYTIYLLAAFLALVSDDWVFVWDFLELAIFVVFAYGIFTRQASAFFVPIFLIGIVNRESALFIAAWLMIDALARRQSRQLWIGAAMLIAGLAFTIVIRQTLFVHSSLDDSSTLIELPLLGNQFNIVESARRAAVHLLNPRLDMMFVVHLAYIFVAAYFAYHWRQVRAHYVAEFALVMAMLAAVPVFGFFNETRQYVYLVPVLLMFNLALQAKLSPGVSTG